MGLREKMAIKLNKPALYFIMAIFVVLTVGCATPGDPLMKAAKRGDTATIEALLAKGADVNVKNKGGKTALNIAASNGRTDVVYLLKKAGTKE